MGGTPHEINNLRSSRSIIARERAKRERTTYLKIVYTVLVKRHKDTIFHNKIRSTMVKDK